MAIRYSISLWNFTHYAKPLSLERIIDNVRQQGFGIELWPSHPGEEDLYDAIGRKRIKPWVKGMTVSLHTAGHVNNFEQHRKQIDAAVDYDAEVLVLHPENLCRAGETTLDVETCGRIVEYAQQGGVKLALENGPLAFLSNAIQQVPGLYICLDTGHVYLSGPGSMAEYLSVIKGRLVHMHAQDTASPRHKALPLAWLDHYAPGDGGIPSDDWASIRATLKEIDFNGIAVFEVHPRNPFELAHDAMRFVEANIRA